MTGPVFDCPLPVDADKLTAWTNTGRKGIDVRKKQSAFASGFQGALGCMAAFVAVAVLAGGAFVAFGIYAHATDENTPYTVVSKKAGAAQTSLKIVVPPDSNEAQVLKWHKQICNSHEGNVHAAYHNATPAPDSSTLIATGTNSSWTWLVDD